MDSRLTLQSKLEEILGSKNVYFQPPESLKINYPAIVYKRSSLLNTFANDNVYNQSCFYEITVIDRKPDSNITKKISRLPKTKFDRSFTSNNLNHDVLTIYY
ncbi:MAG: hypothetical protein ACI35S_00710 [Anaeroplasma sp.]